MKKIHIDSLQINKPLPDKILDKSGKILYAKGVIIDKQKLDALRKKNIINVYLRTDSDEDFNKLLDIGEMNEFDIQEDDPKEALENGGKIGIILKKPPPPPQERLPADEVLPLLKNIENGERGIAQLLETVPVKNLEESLSQAVERPVRPDGPALEDKAREKSVGERSLEYKRQISETYKTALDQAKYLLLTLRNGKSVIMEDILNVIDSFIQTFLNDKHMLLNLANIKCHFNDDYFFSHSINVSLLAISLGASQGFSENQIQEIGMAGFLHDIGTLMIPDSIRFKKDNLTDDEKLEIKKHPIIGIHLLEKIRRLPSSVCFVAYQHHERENRQGFPKARSGRLIHKYSKIIAVADVYESLTSTRPYRKRLIPYKAMEYLLNNVRQGLLDALSVKKYLEYTSLFPVGSLVRLSDNSIAKVVKPNSKLSAKPLLSKIISPDNRVIPDGKSEVVDLAEETRLNVIEAIDNRTVDTDVMHGF
ncbi:MAG: HD domain-containing phosphohydrolase [bacterium]